MTTTERVYPGDETPYDIVILDDAGVLTDPDVLKVHAVAPYGDYAEYIFGTDDEITQDSTGTYVFTMSYPYEKTAEGKWFFDVQALDDTGTPISKKVKPFVETVYPTGTL